MAAAHRIHEAGGITRDELQARILSGEALWGQDLRSRPHPAAGKSQPAGFSRQLSKRATVDRAEKKEAVAALHQVFNGAGAIVVAHYSGLTVAQMQALRKRARAEGIVVSQKQCILVLKIAIVKSFQVPDLVDDDFRGAWRKIQTGLYAAESAIEWGLTNRDCLSTTVSITAKLRSNSSQALPPTSS